MAGEETVGESQLDGDIGVKHKQKTLQGRSLDEAVSLGRSFGLGSQRVCLASAVRQVWFCLPIGHLWLL